MHGNAPEQKHYGALGRLKCVGALLSEVPLNYKRKPEPVVYGEEASKHKQPNPGASWALLVPTVPQTLQRWCQRSAAAVAYKPGMVVVNAVMAVAIIPAAAVKVVVCSNPP
jgi:hypothetical protein